MAERHRRHREAVTGEVKKDPTTGEPVMGANPAWQGIAMVGTRVNNTGPGINATARYILEQAEMTTQAG